MRSNLPQTPAPPPAIAIREDLVPNRRAPSPSTTTSEGKPTTRPWEVPASRNDRVDRLAARYLGDPELWWILCDYNDRSGQHGGHNTRETDYARDSGFDTHLERGIDAVRKASIIGRNPRNLEDRQLWFYAIPTH